MQLLRPPHTRWQPGAPASGNLHGTLRTLDRVGDPVSLACPPVTNFYIYYSHCEEGLISRDGWVLVDESLRPRMRAATFGGEADPEHVARDAGVRRLWPISPNAAALRGAGEYVDWVLFAHGHDYAGALNEFVQLSGRIPLSPRYALGPAFSRWFQWSDAENTAIVQAGFAENGVPLDVHVIDMDCECAMLARVCERAACVRVAPFANEDKTQHVPRQTASAAGHVTILLTHSMDQPSDARQRMLARLRVLARQRVLAR